MINTYFVPVLLDIEFRDNIETEPEHSGEVQRVVAIRFTDGADPKDNTMFYIGPDGTGYPADWVAGVWAPTD